MDRFSLLLLEPGEIYFCDVGVTLHDDANATTPNPKEQVWFFKLLPPPWWSFHLLSWCYISHVKNKYLVNQYILHMNWNCVYKSQLQGRMLAEIPTWKALAGEFRTCDLPIQILFDLGFGHFQGSIQSDPILYSLLSFGNQSIPC